MSQTETDNETGASQPTSKPTEPKSSEPKPTEPKPTRTLPTNRVAFNKQLEILRAFGAVGDTTRAVFNSEVAKLVGLHASTIGLTVPFFTDIGLLKKTNEGVLPTQEVVSFNQAYKWSPDTAAQRLHPIMSRAWFAEALIPRLRFNPMSPDAAVQELALVASAGPSYRGQLETLLDYLQASGVVAVKDGDLHLVQKMSQRPDADASDEPKPVAVTEAPPATRHSPVTTMFAGDTAGVVQFNIQVKVDMTEFAGWEPARITAFFAGIAQVLAAKGTLERQASGS